MEFNDDSVNPFSDVGGNNRHVRFRSCYRFLCLYLADKRDVVKSVIAFATHSVKKIEGGFKRWVEVLLSKLKNGDMVAELYSRTLSVAQHQRQRRLQHGLICRLVGGFLIDYQVFPGGYGLLFRVCQKFLHLLWNDLLRFCCCHFLLPQSAFRSKCR